MTNIYNLFKFLEDKEGRKTPLDLKLIYASDELTPDELNIKGSLNLKNPLITSLPDGLTVGGNLDLRGTRITSLPNGLTVGGELLLGKIPLVRQFKRMFSKEINYKKIENIINAKGGSIGGEISGYLEK